MKFYCLSAALLGTALLMTAPVYAQHTTPSAGMLTSSGGSSSSYPCNNNQFLQDQQNFESGTISSDQFVDICGTVTAVLPEKDTTSGHHGYFYVQVAPGTTIEIVSDLDQMDAPAWPWVVVGDSVYVQGRYYYDNDDSQGIDWTHQGTSNSWPHAGYVVVNGTEYQ